MRMINNANYKRAPQRVAAVSPHLACTCLILSTDLQIPLQLHSNDATHTLPACAFHSHSAATRKVADTFIQRYVTSGNRSCLKIPGGVPQHMLRSSMCSTSRPISHAPSDTSSFAYLCRMGLKSPYYLT